MEKRNTNKERLALTRKHSKVKILKDKKIKSKKTWELKFGQPNIQYK